MALADHNLPTAIFRFVLLLADKQALLSVLLPHILHRLFTAGFAGISKSQEPIWHTNLGLQTVFSFS